MASSLRFLPAGSVRRRVAAGVVWSSAATAFQSLAGLLVGIGLARVLGTAGFGEWGVLNSTIATLGVVAGLGLGTTATKYVAELRDADPARLGRLLAILDRLVYGSSAAIAAILFLLAPALTGGVLGAPHLDAEFRVACGLLLANALLGVQTGILGGLEAFRQIAVLNLARALVAVPLSVGAAAAFGLMGAVAAMTAVGLGTWLASAVVARRMTAALGIVRDARGASAELGILWRFSLPALLSAVMVAPPMWIANVMLVAQPAGFAELGGFTAANQWRAVVTFVPGVVGVATLPILSSLFGAGSSSTPRVLAGSIALSLVAAAPIALVIGVGSSLVMGLSGDEFRAYADVLVIVAITSVVIAAQLPIGSMVAAVDRMWLGAGMNLGWSIVFLGTAAVLLGLGWGALGLAIAYLVAYGVHSIWSLAFALRSSGVRSPARPAPPLARA
jgi:O-antigen/teichoic acid export membrane protein